MSCQQVSRFITTTPSIINTNTTVTITTTTTTSTVTSTSSTTALIATPTTAAGAETALVSIKPATAIAASTAFSTTSSSIASLTAATAEDQDPYVFTESVHATPPVHFNAQKSRIRHVDSAILAATTTITDTDTVSEATATNVNNCNNNNATAKFTRLTPAAAITTTATTTTTVEGTTTSATTAVSHCTAVSTVTTISTSKITATTLTSPIQNGTQQQQQQQQPKCQTHSKSPLLFTSPPVSPQLGVRVQQQQHTKIMSPTCGLQLTPSLWQTPLLLDTNASNSNNIPTTNFNNNINVNNSNKITSINGNNFSNATTPLSTTNGTHVIINSPLHSPTTVTAALMANITHSAIPLPPSNFHHTTLAQHLQKVECIKKPPKRQNINTMCIATHKAIITPPATPPTSSTTLSPVLLPPLQPLQTSIEQIQQKVALTITSTATTTTSKENTQCAVEEKQQKQQLQQQEEEHSDTDLNEIPVNVIFRKPQIAATINSTINTNIKETPTKRTTIVTTTPSTAELPKQPFEQPKLIQFVTSPIIQQQQKQSQYPVQIHQQQHLQQPQKQQQHQHQQICKPTLIMPCTKVDIEAAVSTLQSMQQKALKEGMSSNVHQQEQHNYLNVQQVVVNKSISNQTPAMKPIKISAQKLEISSNKKIRSKQPLVPPFLNQNSLAADHGSAVAVVKMSSIELCADTEELSNISVLPYCVQKHWLNSECPQMKNIVSREDRIAQSKNLLRRQALQLINTHSLQKLPLHSARKRLICVDRLLRKYDEQKLHTDRLK